MVTLHFPHINIQLPPSKSNQSYTHQNMMSQRIHSCALCPRVFRSLHSRNRHRREQHLAPNRYQCTLCPSVFPRLANLKRHRTLVHSIQIVMDRPNTSAASGDCPEHRDLDTTRLPDISQDILAIADMLGDMDTEERNGDMDTDNPDWWT